MGQKRPNPLDSKHVTVLLPMRVWDELDRRANFSGRSLQSLTCEILETWASASRGKTLSITNRNRSRQMALELRGV